MSLTRIGSIGINTGIAFAGVTTIVTLNTANDALSIGATVNVGSGITLGASGDIFATGVSTFSGNLKVGSGVTISPDGDVFFTGIATGNGSGLTALNATQLTSGTVPTARLGSGTASSSTFLRGDSTFQTVNTDLVSDTSPQLGGNLDVNTKNILFGDSGGATDDRLTFGAGTDLSIYHDGSHSRIVDSGTGNLILQTSKININNADGTEGIIHGTAGGAVEIYHANSNKFSTLTNGVQVSGSEFISEGTIYLEKSGAHHHRILANDSGNDLGFQQSSDTGANTNFTTYLRIKDGGDIALPVDNKKLLLGAGEDLRIYHDGSHSYISDQGTGQLKILSNLFRVNNAADDEAMIKAEENAGVTLSYNGNTSIETIADGGVKATGNYVVGTSGRGLQFNASDSGSANLLDDYEEGEFNPTFVTSSGSISANSSYDTLAYTKIGRMVHVMGQLVLTVSNPGGNLDMASLPFVFAQLSETSERGWALNVGYFNGSSPAGSNHFAFQVRLGEGAGTSTVRLQGVAPNDDGSIADWCANGTDLWFNFWYITSA